MRRQDTAHREGRFGKSLLPLYIKNNACATTYLSSMFQFGGVSVLENGDLDCRTSPTPSAEVICQIESNGVEYAGLGLMET